MNPPFAHRCSWSLVLGVTAFVVFVERAQRRITVNYAKRQEGRRMYAGQSSHLPFKINMSGVIPPIFASSILLFPATDRELRRHRPGPAREPSCRTSRPRSATASRCTCVIYGVL